MIIEPVWDQFAALLPHRQVTHPVGCHRPRIPDREVFDTLVQVLVFAVVYATVADTSCSAATRGRREERITAGVFDHLEQVCLQACDRVLGLDLAEVIVDGCITKAPCGGRSAGKSLVDRDKQGTTRSLLVEESGIPLGCVVAAADRHDQEAARRTAPTGVR